jgi:hypothetical protein
MTALSLRLVLAALLILAAPVAGNAAPKPKAASDAKAAPEAAASEQLLSDSWFTVLIDGKIRYGYYNDRVELRKGRLFFQNHYWKKEEDFLNEEQLGAYAENNEALTPLFFNYHSSYMGSETVVDGTIADGKTLTVKAKHGGSDRPGVRKILPAGTILEVFFPIWLGKRAQGLKAGQTVQFRAVFEDSIATGFATEAGKVKAEKPDEFASKSGTAKFTVEVRGLRSHWWIDSKGIPARIEMPQQKIRVDRVSKEEATSFLGVK